MARQKENLDGKTFKSWKVIREVEQRGKNRYFLAECLKCEVNYEVAYSSLKSKNRYFCCNSCSIQKENLDGQVFKNWKVIKEVAQRGNDRYFLAECLKCNKNYEMHYGHLKSKNSNFCCKNCAYGDLSGKKFGRLLVIKKHSQYKNSHWKYLCKCDCGMETIVAGVSLKNGNTSSCGCYFKDQMSGSNNPSWKGGVTPVNKIKRKLEKQTKQLSKERDNHTCQKCGDNKGGNLESHHVFDFDHYPELQNNIYNFITLCKKCHGPNKNPNSFHYTYSHVKENTLNDLETWLGHKFKYHQSLLNYYEYYYGEIY